MKFSSLFFLVLILISCKEENYKSRRIESVEIIEFNLDSASIRAIAVLKNTSPIFATNIGYFGSISNDDIHVLPQFKFDTVIPHFRAIANNGISSFILSVGNPALLYKIDGDKSKLVYKEEHEKVFYDSMKFFDEKNGIAMGDPTEDCLSVILTNDGGNTWQKIACSDLPKTENGEAAFAASNTNIATYKKNAWIVTGGKKARVFHSYDMGKTWSVYDTPIIQGGAMTGIYSVDFYNDQNGIIIGGDWENKDRNTSNKAITKDGGKTWTLVADGAEPGYKSCVQYVPDTQGKELFAVGTTGISFSNDSGLTWKKVSTDEYYTIQFANKNLAWLAGKNRIGKLILK